MANYFANIGEYSKDKINVYAYGFELLISTVFNAVGLLIISIVMGIIFETFLFSLAFILLRTTAGGYHAKHHWSCFLIVNIGFILFAKILSLLPYVYTLPYIIFVTSITSFLIWLFSPIRATNNPLSEEQKDMLRKRSIIIVTINMAITFIFTFAPQLPINFLKYYQSGAFAAATSLTVTAITMKRKEK